MANSSAKLDAPEAVYIEITDPEFDVASVQAADFAADIQRFLLQKVLELSYHLFL